MYHKKSEKGQAIILIVFAMIGLIGLTGLTVDGGMAYSDRRHAQNAADSAAFAAALAHSRGEDEDAAARSVATLNGYANNVTVTPRLIDPVLEPDVCPNNTAPDPADMNVANMEYTVGITSTVKTSFATVVGIQTMTNKVTATTRACGTYMAPLFGGNAIVGLNPGTNGQCGFNSGNGNAATWEIHGAGVFSNGCGFSKVGAVTLDTDKCVGTVGTATGLSPLCDPKPAAYNYPADVHMPPTPACDGTAEGGYVVPNNPSSFTFDNGVYCVTNFDAFSQETVVLNNATLYVFDMDFDVTVTGNGTRGFSGTASTSGVYKGYYLIVAMKDPPCPWFSGPGSNTAQQLALRGNAGSNLTGTIMAPSACIDWRGNSSGTMNTKIIGYNVSSNGSVEGNITYLEDEQAKSPAYPLIELLK